MKLIVLLTFFAGILLPFATASADALSITPVRPPISLPCCPCDGTRTRYRCNPDCRYVWCPPREIDLPCCPCNGKPVNYRCNPNCKFIWCPPDEIDLPCCPCNGKPVDYQCNPNCNYVWCPPDDVSTLQTS